MGNKLMLWKAEYKDGTILREDVDTFDKLDRNNIEMFSLEGLDTRFVHHVETGKTSINENVVLFLLNDKLIGKSSDVINYKEKIKSVSNPFTNIPSDIIGYYTGWKEKNEDFSMIEVLYWVDMLNKEIKVRLRLTPKNVNVLNSTFSMVINGELGTEEITFPNIDKRSEFVFKIFNQQNK